MKIKRKLYSSPYYIEDEKLFFNPVTRLKRLGQKYIGRTRRDVAEKLMESAIKDKNSQKKAIDIINNQVRKENPVINLAENKNIAKKLIRQSHDNGGRVISGSENAFVPNKSIDVIKLGEYRKDFDSKDLSVYNHIINPSKTSIITLSDNANIATLAHEIGHQSRYTSGNLLSKLDMKSSGDYYKKYGKIKLNSKKHNIPRFIARGAVKLVEERGASKDALKYLKEAGASPEQLLRSKRHLKLCGDTYKYANSASNKALISDWIQIPSRKREAIVKKLKTGGNKV